MDPVLDLVSDLGSDLGSDLRWDLGSLGIAIAIRLINDYSFGKSAIFLLTTLTGILSAQKG